MNKALDYLHRAGLKTCQAPSNWWNDAPEGYQYSTCITNIQNTSFEKQWQKLIGNKPNIDAIIGLDETAHRTIVYERIPQDQIDNANRAKQAEKQREPTRANRRRRHGNCTMPAKPCEPNGSIKPRTHGKKPMMQQDPPAPGRPAKSSATTNTGSPQLRHSTGQTRPSPHTTA